MTTLITKDSINEFIASNNPRAITQTGYWLDIEKAHGHHAYIIYTTENNQISASVLLIKHTLPMGRNYLYAPYGPVIKKDLTPEAIPGVMKKLYAEIERFVDLSATIFIRFEPFYQDCHTIFEATKKLGFKPTGIATQPKDTSILPLFGTQEEVFAGFKSKTRYNIRLADKKSITIQRHTEPDQVKIFYELMLKTCDRKEFRPHPLQHYQNIMRILGSQDLAYIYHAYYQNKVIASIMVSHFGHVASYLHGASSNTYRNLMPTYALQWRAIQDAMKVGCRYYDFGGISPKNAPANHKWIGITRFKEGFGGIDVHTIGHMNKTISPFWHFIYKTAKYFQN